MKKYLMTGMAAIAFCAAFTSCSKEITPMTEEEMVAVGVQKIYSDYEAAFQKVFGTPAPGHTWGFSDAAGTRGAYPNANMWSDEWHVPDALTADQKLRVTRYFQSHPNLTYNDPEWSNYFIQQVYKGGGSQRNDSQWCTSDRDEWYTSANNGNVVGSDHMDHLIAKSSSGATDHIFNFNNGDCGYNGSVSTDGYPRDTNLHGDKIQLMTNSYTYTFTYGSTDADMVRERRCALVDAAEIDRWATQEAGGIGAAVSSDKYNRKFMGFDFEQRVSEEIFAKNDDGTPRYAKVGDGPMAKNYYWDGNEVKVLTDEVKNTLLGVRMLINETNMYCGINGDIDQNNLYSKHDRKYMQDGQERTQQEDCLDLTLVYQRISDGYYPVVGSNLTKWVKPQGGADGYYSDWIVTLTKAEPVNQVSANIRVMAEDLSAGESGEDFDFNDVVFDVYFSDEVGEAYVMVQAAGGTLPLTVHGTEVHRLFNQPTNKMINTQAEKKGLNGISGLAPQKIQLTGITVNSKEEANTKIKIYVTKEIKLPDGSTTTKEIELVNSNAAACKIGVPPTTGIAVERTNVNGVLGSNEWVTNGIPWPTN